MLIPLTCERCQSDLEEVQPNMYKCVGCGVQYLKSFSTPPTYKSQTALGSRDIRADYSSYTYFAHDDREYFDVVRLHTPPFGCEITYRKGNYAKRDTIDLDNLFRYPTSVIDSSQFERIILRTMSRLAGREITYEEVKGLFNANHNHSF